MSWRPGVRACWAAWVCLVLAGCGGGGGGGGAAEPARFAVAFSVPQVEAQALQQLPARTTLQVSLSTTAGPDTPVFIALRGGQAVLQDVEIDVAAGPTLTLLFRADLPPGRHEDTLELLLCADEACSRRLAEGPFLLPLALEVRPNIVVSTQQVLLARGGREAAPTADVTLTLPEGGLALRLRAAQGGPDDTTLRAALDGTTLRVAAGEVPAGEYSRRFHVESEDGRYTNRIDVAYTVSAPPGGERGVVLAQTLVSLQTNESGALRYRITVTPATWTEAISVRNDFNSPLLRLERVAPDAFELAVDPGLGAGRYHVPFELNAPTGSAPPAVLTIDLQVRSDIVLPAVDPIEITAATTPSQLRYALPIATVDGAAVRWSAVALAETVRLTRSQGLTGIDRLEFELLPERMRPGQNDPVSFRIAIERPGTEEQWLSFFARSRVTWIDSASESAWTDAQPLRLRLVGAFPERIDTSGALRVDGATLGAVRFGPSGANGTPPVWLELELAGMHAGTPVDIRVESALFPQQHRLEVRPAERWPARVEALPHRRWRPPVHAGAQRAYYFTGGDTLMRLAWTGSAWSVNQRAWSDLIDADLTADQRELAVWRHGSLQRIDALTLQDTAAAGPAGLLMSDAMRASAQKLVRVGLDNTAWWVRFSDADPFCNGYADFQSLPARLPISGSSFSYALGDCLGPALGASVVASGDRSRIDIVPQAAGVRGRGFDLLARQPVYWDGGPVSGAGGAGMDYAGTWLADAAGHLSGDTYRQTWRPSVAAALRPGETLGGIALSPDGARVHVYAYTITGSGTSAQALAPRLVGFDRSAAWDWAGAQPVLDVVLPQAAGCRAGRPADEPCEHHAHLLVEPSGANLLIVGPDAAIAQPLPVPTVLRSGVRPAGAARRIVPLGWQR
jgi:hypothetical protein